MQGIQCNSAPKDHKQNKKTQKAHLVHQPTTSNHKSKEETQNRTKRKNKEQKKDHGATHQIKQQTNHKPRAINATKNPAAIGKCTEPKRAQLDDNAVERY